MRSMRRQAWHVEPHADLAAVDGHEAGARLQLQRAAGVDAARDAFAHALLRGGTAWLASRSRRA